MNEILFFEILPFIFLSFLLSHKKLKKKKDTTLGK